MKTGVQKLWFWLVLLSAMGMQSCSTRRATVSKPEQKEFSYSIKIYPEERKVSRCSISKETRATIDCNSWYIIRDSVWEIVNDSTMNLQFYEKIKLKQDTISNYFFAEYYPLSANLHKEMLVFDSSFYVKGYGIIFLRRRMLFVSFQNNKDSMTLVKRESELYHPVLGTVFQLTREDMMFKLDEYNHSEEASVNQYYYYDAIRTNRKLRKSIRKLR